MEYKWSKYIFCLHCKVKTLEAEGKTCIAVFYHFSYATIFLREKIYSRIEFQYDSRGVSVHVQFICNSIRCMIHTKGSKQTYDTLLL